jgi:transcriptional regulator with XRE-family HTH domain
MATDIATLIGHEVELARANLGLSRRAAARVAGVSPFTQRRVETGDPSVGLDTLCRVAHAVGLKVWARAFPARTASLRDTGQLHVAEYLRSTAHSAYRFALEVGVGNGRSIDVVLFGADEILAIEIERMLSDFQAQYRAAVAKRDELAAAHQRPVRLVFVVEDSRRNRRAVSDHVALLQSALPAGSRAVLRSIRTGDSLGRDGMLWVRTTGRVRSPIA